jgi:hypothetical protein
MLPKTCPQRSARPCRRFGFRAFPASFECPGRGDLVEALRFTEVLCWIDEGAICGEFPTSREASSEPRCESLLDREGHDSH